MTSHDSGIASGVTRAIARARRVLLRHRWQVEYERSLNRRAEVEQDLFDAARGKRPMPDQAQLRKWAIKLGVPNEWRDDAEQRAFKDFVSAAQWICDAGGLAAHATGCGQLRKALAAYLRERS